MKAIIYDRYGPPDVLHLEEVKRPIPSEDEVLVRIHATTVNRSDCHHREATWRSTLIRLLLSRSLSDCRRPRQSILGNEMAGVVEAVGAAVTEFKVGDEVFGETGWGFGTHAEYVCMRENGRIADKPHNLSFVEAAAVCNGAINALWCLSQPDPHAGQTVLVYGASGSIGTAGVQLARYFGLHITAVCNTKNVELVKSLGADEVIDYLTEDFTRNGRTYDIIFDAVGKLSFTRCRRSLKPGGS